MTTAEKLLRAKQDFDDVYEAGVNIGSDYDKFWDIKQQKGKRTNYSKFFADWKDELFIPKYEFGKISNAYQMFFNSKIKDLYTKLLSVNKSLNESDEPILNLSECEDPTEIFRDSEITHIPSLIFPKDTPLKGTFYNANKLHTIQGLCLNNNTFNGSVFEKCAALANINKITGNFIGNVSFLSCGQLTKASIINIVGALSENTSGTLSLSQNAVHWAFAEHNGLTKVVDCSEQIVLSNEPAVILYSGPGVVDSPKNILISFNYNPADYPTEFSDNTFLTVTCGENAYKPQTYYFKAKDIFKAGGVGYIGIFNSYITNVTITNQCKFSGKLENIRVETVNSGLNSQEWGRLIAERPTWLFSFV